MNMKRFSFLLLSVVLLTACGTAAETKVPDMPSVAFKSTELFYDSAIWQGGTIMEGSIELISDSFCWLDVSGDDMSGPASNSGITLTTQEENGVTLYYWDDDLSYVDFPVGGETAYGSVSWGGDTEACKEAFVQLAELNNY